MKALQKLFNAWAPALFLGIAALVVLDESSLAFFLFACAAMTVSPAAAPFDRLFHKKSRRRIRLSRFAVGFLLFVSAIFILPPESFTIPKPETDSTFQQATKPDFDGSRLYPVVSVADGDTISVLVDEEVESIRMIGIDAPERSATRTGYVECFGEEASRFAENFFAGQQVRLLIDETQDRHDRYGRLLAHVFLENGVSYQEEALRAGYALYYLYRDPSAFDDEYLLAEAEAEENNRGLWRACDGERRPARQE